MERLRTPLMAGAVYLILLGIIAIFPALWQSLFADEVRDPGMLRVLSSIFLGFGVVVWSIASKPEQYGGLVTAIVIALAISTLFLLWGWVGGLYTVRTAIGPIIINVVLAAWVWTSRPKS